MLNKIQNNYRSNIVFALLVVMLAALFFSRALLSTSMICFVVLSLWNRNIDKQVKHVVANIFLVSISLLFLIPFVSGLWSDNLNAWLDVIRVKLPLFFFPLAFAGNWQLSQKQWRWLLILLLLLLLASSLWSFAYYLQHLEEVHKGYLKAKVMVTPFEDDHIRYSWLLSVGVLICFYLFERKQSSSKYLLLLLAAWFIIYLHLLSARTGLICVYVILFAFLVYQVLKRRRKKAAISGLVLLLVLPLAAYFFFPTFQNRYHYFQYDLGAIKENKYLPGSNDGARTLSLKAGWAILKSHPAGVGAGDIFDAAQDWYHRQVPGILPNDQLFPSSEWLIYGAIMGWAGVLLFSMIMLLPFFLRIRFRFYWCLFQLVAMLSFLFDIGLESQNGVFLYTFLLLVFWKQWKDHLFCSD